MPTQIATGSYSDATQSGVATLVGFAPSDGSAIVVYHTGAGDFLATAQSPYTVWSTQAIGSASTRNAQALVVNADDSVHVLVQSPASGAYYFHYTRSGNTWTNNANAVVDGTYTSNLGGPGASGWIGVDPQGRVWVVGEDNVLATFQVYVDVSTNGGSTWSPDATMEALNLGEKTNQGVCAAIIGGWLVVVYDSGGGNLSYRRLNVAGASLGAWSAAQAVSVGGDVTTSSVLALAAIPGGSTGMLLHSGSNGITATPYNAGTDTWGGNTILTASTSDVQPALIPQASGNILAVWSKFAAANSYSLVYKNYNGTAWDAGTTQLEASGSNRHWVNGAYKGAGTIGFIWTEGTANPYSIQWDTATLGGGIVSGSATLLGAGAIGPGLLAGSGNLPALSSQAVGTVTLRGAGALAGGLLAGSGILPPPNLQSTQLALALATLIVRSGISPLFVRSGNATLTIR
jgi:hypothetical protein